MSQKSEENSLCNNAMSEVSENIQPNFNNPIDLKEKEIPSDDITDGITTKSCNDKIDSNKEEMDFHNITEIVSDEELGAEINNLEQMDSMEPLAATRSDTPGKFNFARIVFNMTTHYIS